MMSGGFDARPSGESLASLAQAVERMDRKLTKLLTTPTSGIPVSSSLKAGYESFLKAPHEAYLEALQSGAIAEAYKILERIKKVSDTHEYIAALGLLVSMGEERALAVLESATDEVLKEGSKIDKFDDLLTTIAQVLQNYANNTGKFKELVEYLDDFLTKLLPRGDVTNDTKAFVANKICMLSWTARDYERCIRYTKQAKELNPEPSYSYNLCLAYKRQDMSEELAKEGDCLSKMPDLDDDHKALLVEQGYNI